MNTIKKAIPVIIALAVMSIPMFLAPLEEGDQPGYIAKSINLK